MIIILFLARRLFFLPPHRRLHGHGVCQRLQLSYGPKRPKFGLFSENFSLVVCLLCTPTNWPETGGQIWGPSAFKTRQTRRKLGQLGSTRSSAELPHDSLRDFEGASPAICGRRPQIDLRSSLCRAQRAPPPKPMRDGYAHRIRLKLGRSHACFPRCIPSSHHGL